MQQTSETATWETPRLIILERGMPEENVLLGCKQHNLDLGGGPGTLYPCIEFSTPCDAAVPS